MSKSKTSNKGLIIVTSICAAVVLAIIFVFAFLDMLVGNVKLSKVSEGIVGCETVIISDPLYEGALAFGAERTVEGESARKLTERLIGFADNSSFDGMIAQGKGFWDIKLRFITGSDEYSVYLKKDGIYVTSVSGYFFLPDDQGAYAEFYQGIKELISNEG